MGKNKIVYGTVFDDVFRTMVQKMPQLIIPLINEMFHTAYAEDEIITQIRNEFEEPFGKIITDSIYIIQSHTYHIECQSIDDVTMAFRMIQYDFSIALEQATRDGRMYEIDFPHTGVLYLRDTDSTPDELKVKVRFPNGTWNTYSATTIKVSRYTKEDIFQKRLFCLLPYYVLKYEKRKEKLVTNQDELTGMLAEFENIRVRLEETFATEDKSCVFTDLIGLIVKIADYIFQNEQEIKKGVGLAMGGNVLKLRSEELIEQGLEQGLEQGIKIYIHDKLEEHYSESEIMARLTKNFSLTEEKAKEYFDKYAAIFVS